MSHQTGITDSKELTDTLIKAREGQYRIISVKIRGESLVCEKFEKPSSNFEADYKNMASSFFNEKENCYVLVRTDDKNTNDRYMWVFITFSHDFAPVRDKMLYAATKQSFKQNFGSDLIIDEIYGTVIQDVDFNGYKKHLSSKNAAPPLTFTEKEKIELKKMEKVHAVTDKAETLPGISFPIEKKAIESLNSLKSGSKNYVQLSVNVANEQILLQKCDKISLDKINSMTSNEPRYHFIHFNKAIIFIYTMPGYSCSVKDRMMYSSCKNPLLTLFEKEFSPISCKLELENLNEVNEKFLNDELNPPKVEEKKTFAKPKRPGKR